MSSNREAFDELVSAAGDSSPVLVALGRTIADELDRQARLGEGMNAQLVQRYMDVIGGVADVDDSDPADALLRKILDEASAGEAEPDRPRRTRRKAIRD